MRALRVVVVAIALGFSISAQAFLEPLLDSGEWDGETGFEYRYFNNPGEYGQAQNAVSLRFQGQYYTAWNDDDDSFTFVPFLRIDQQDAERSHADIREALWVHVGDSWELRSGITQVFWGRTEFAHLVDVVNQTDLVDGDEEKLGQPMINLSLVHDWGIFDFYWLLGFRERTFAGEDGRLRSPILIDTDHPVYFDNSSPQSLDFAFRWQTPVTDELEMALSLFSGVDREPSFSFNFDFVNPMLIPNYSHKDQIGLELEYIYEGWAFKFEGINVRSSVQDYDSTVVGVEYTFNAIFNSNIDMTFITEYIWDSRDDATPGFIEQDVGFGARFAFNDEFDSALLAGFLWDPYTDEKLASIEGERRIFDDFKIKVLGRLVMDRGEAPVGDTAAEILAALANSSVVGSGNVDQEFILDFLYQLIKEEGLDVLFQNEEFVPALQQLQRLADGNRKLSIIESDSYIQLELVYFY